MIDWFVSLALSLLVNPNNLNTDSVVRELREVSQSRGFALHVVAVTTKSDLDTAIANLVQAGAGSFMYLGRAESPTAAKRRAEGAGLEGECAYRATIE